MSSTSVGRGPASGGNENHDGDPRNTTMGETVKQEPPAGAELIDQAAADVSSGVQGGETKPGIAKGRESYPKGPNAEGGPQKPDAARGKQAPR